MEPITHIPFAYDVGPLELTGFGLAMLLAGVAGSRILHVGLLYEGPANTPRPYCRAMRPWEWVASLASSTVFAPFAGLTGAAKGPS